MRATLLTVSCTTGWLHWGHGELWLTDDALVRVGLKALTQAEVKHGVVNGLAPHFGGVGGLAASLLARPDAPRVPADPGRTLDVDPDWWSTALASSHDVRSYPLVGLRGARLRTGLTTTSLRFRQPAGEHVVLLWKRDAAATHAVRAALPAHG